MLHDEDFSSHESGQSRVVVFILGDHWGSSPPHLVHTVQELQENGREAAALAAGTQVAALAELVAEGQPLLLQQHLETLQSPVEGVAEQLHQTHHLQRGREGGGVTAATGLTDE